MPGEIVVFSDSGVKSRKKEHCGRKKRRTCIFEYIYFARPDSVIDGVSVSKSRIHAGKILAEAFPADADIVIGVPDSGLEATVGFSEASGIPYGIGLIKNKYIGRTFISPEKNERTDGVGIKLSPVKNVVEGKKIVLIDDSIVRGTTSRRIVKLLRDAGAKEIHMRISAPPFAPMLLRHGHRFRRKPDCILPQCGGDFENNRIRFFGILSHRKAESACRQ